MRKLLAAFLLLFAFNLLATDVHFSLKDARLGTDNFANRTVWLQYLSAPSSYGPSTINYSKIITNSDANGLFDVGTMVPGLYSMAIQAPPDSSTTYFVVLADNLGTINAGDYIVLKTSNQYVWANSVNKLTSQNGTVTFSPTNGIGVVDLSASGSIPLAAGNNISIVFTNGTNIISSTGGTGSGVTNNQQLPGLSGATNFTGGLITATNVALYSEIYNPVDSSALMDNNHILYDELGNDSIDFYWGNGGGYALNGRDGNPTLKWDTSTGLGLGGHAGLYGNWAHNGDLTNVFYGKDGQFAVYSNGGVYKATLNGSPLTNLNSGNIAAGGASTSNLWNGRFYSPVGSNFIATVGVTNLWMFNDIMDPATGIALMSPTRTLWDNNGNDSIDFGNSRLLNDAAGSPTLAFGSSLLIGNWGVSGNLTNSTLTAKTVVMANGSKILTSIPNAIGYLNNDGAGNFSWSSVGSGGAATNAIAQVGSNDVAIVSPSTNLVFWVWQNLIFGLTNRNNGTADVGIRVNPSLTNIASVGLSNSASITAATGGNSNAVEIVNKVGQTVARFGTNGTAVIGTNNQVVVDTAGDITFAGQLNGSGAGLNAGSVPISALASIAAFTTLANPNSGAAAPSAVSTALLLDAIGNTLGGVAYRAAGYWTNSAQTSDTLKMASLSVTNILNSNQINGTNGIALYGSGPTMITTSANGMSNVVSFTTGSNGINVAVGSYNNPSNILSLTNTLNGLFARVYGPIDTTSGLHVAGQITNDALSALQPVVTMSDKTLASTADISAYALSKVATNDSRALTLSGTNYWAGNNVFNGTQTIASNGLAVVGNFNVTNGVIQATNTSAANQGITLDPTKTYSTFSQGEVGIGTTGITNAGYLANAGAAGLASAVVTNAIGYITNAPATGNATITWDMSKDYSMVSTSVAVTVNITGLQVGQVFHSTLVLSNQSGTARAVTGGGFSMMTNSVNTPTSALNMTNNDTKHQRLVLKADGVAGVLTNVWAFQVYDP